jgi:hypothetical protein
VSTALRPTVYISPYYVWRWQGRIDPAADDLTAIANIQRIVTRGDELAMDCSVIDCSGFRYFVHKEFPTAVVAVRSSSNHAVTVIRRSELKGEVVA